MSYFDDRLAFWRQRENRHALRIATLEAIKASTLDPSDRWLLTVIAGYIDPATGAAWPGKETIASETGFDVRTVQRRICRCKGLRWLSVSPEASPLGTDVYRITPAGELSPPKVRRPSNRVVRPPEAPAGCHPLVGEGVATDPPKGWQPVREGVASCPGRGGTLPPDLGSGSDQEADVCGCARAHEAPTGSIQHSASPQDPERAPPIQPAPSTAARARHGIEGAAPPDPLDAVAAAALAEHAPYLANDHSLAGDAAAKARQYKRTPAQLWDSIESADDKRPGKANRGLILSFVKKQDPLPQDNERAINRDLARRGLLPRVPPKTRQPTPEPEERAEPWDQAATCAGAAGALMAVQQRADVTAPPPRRPGPASEREAAPRRLEAAHG